MSEYTIKVEVTASSRESAVGQLEAEMRWLKGRDFAVTDVPHAGSFVSSGGHTLTYSTEVKGPPEPPLSQAEIRKLRAIIPNIAG